MFQISKKYLLRSLTILAITTLGCQAAGATPLAIFDSSWTKIADDDGVVSPGAGGQAFDAEYLFYKVEGNTLSIGLQTGFNVIDGVQQYAGHDYYAGDLALSFDGDTSIYEYAFDFGNYTEGYFADADRDKIAAVAAGLYEVSSWSNDVYAGYTASNPFAMLTGTYLGGNTLSGFVDGEGTTNDSITSLDSYWRTVSFDLDAFGAGFNFTQLDTHWTMSCGNDAIDGSAAAPVPEPATMLLFGTGLAGLISARRRKKK